MDGEREKVWFGSGGTQCAAWHYRGSNGGCVIMAGGFAVTKEAGTDLFARRFAAAGFSVLAFDYRHLGESGGQPRQVVRVREQLADWSAAIGFAASLAEVDPARLAAWAFSASGGYMFTLAARDTRLAAAIAQTPNADNVAAARNAARYQKPGAMLRFLGRALLDSAGGLAGRPPRLVPLSAEPGTVAVVTTPDSAQGDAATGPVRGMAAGSSGAFGAAAHDVTAGAGGRPGTLPAAGGGVRPGHHRPGRPRGPGGTAGARGRARSAAGRALRAVPGRARAGRRDGAVVPAAVPARRAGARAACGGGR